MDVLSDVLRTVRLHGAFFLHGDFGAPWCVDVPCGAEMARQLTGGSEPPAVVHYVLEGSCWVFVAGSAPLLLEEGDIVVMPHGLAHRIGARRDARPIDENDAADPIRPNLDGSRYGGDGDRSVLVCGWFTTDPDVPNPLREALPPVFTASIGKRATGAWLEQSLRFALRIVATGHPGSSVIASKVAEALYVEALRAHVESLPHDATGWLAGMSDPLVARCLTRLHADPGRRWTVDALAREVHSSRSVVAERFHEVLGVPPMHYLTRWRLSLARRLLRDVQGSIAGTAGRVGYDSEAAFHRAFKREFGIAPGRFRRQSGRAPDASTTGASESVT